MDLPQGQDVARGRQARRDRLSVRISRMATATTHEERVAALADVIGVPAENIVPIFRSLARQQQSRASDGDGRATFSHADGATDEALIAMAYRDIDMIRKHADAIRIIEP